jgi:glutamine synthetase
MTSTTEGFVARHELYSDEQREAAARAEATVREQGLRTVRVVWVDQHGLPRARFASPEAFGSALRTGLDMSGAVVNLDSGNQVFAAAFQPGGGVGVSELTGFPDVVLVPDPTTFQVLPWADRTGWVLTDAYFSNGAPHALDSRGLLRRHVQAAAELGYRYQAGLEVEFYLLRNETGRTAVHETGHPAPAPPISILEQGYQFLSENRLASLEEIVTPLRDALLAVGVPLRTMEDEWGPGQLEFTCHPSEGLGPADAMVLFRGTVKQVAQRHGLLATFMSRPALPNISSSGWHLHQSLIAAGGGNAFTSDTDVLSDTGRAFAAGILEHAIPMTAFASPTITGFKRYLPYSFAPDNVNWALENRGAMLRVQGVPGDPGTHLENRLGEPAANPYLYVAANLAAGLDGVRRELTPPPLAGPDPYSSGGTPLPGTLWDAIDALDRDAFYRTAFGDTLIDYLVSIKRSEIHRFLSEVTDWEMREYLETF